MAEIRVEKRKKPLWPWILGLLAVVVAAFLLLNNNEVKEAEEDLATTVTGNEGGQAAGMAENETKASTEVTGIACIDKFSSFVQENQASKKAGANHAYTHDGLKYLSCSLESLIEDNNLNDAGLEDKRKSLTEAAKKIQEEASSENHANEIKSAFKDAVAIMEELQETSYPDLKDKIAEVRNAAKDLEVNSTTLEQEDELDDFFKKASNALVAMRDNK